jgi:hypothetical protein
MVRTELPDGKTILLLVYLRYITADGVQEVWSKVYLLFDALGDFEFPFLPHFGEKEG